MKHIITLLLLLVTFTVAAQSYSPCYTEFMAKGNAAYNQGKYSEAKTYYETAKKCAGGNPAEAQKKIDLCDTKLNSASTGNYSNCYLDNMALGDVHYEHGDYKKAKSCYAKAMKCSGSNLAEAQRKIYACEAKIKESQDKSQDNKKKQEGKDKKPEEEVKVEEADMGKADSLAVVEQPEISEREIVKEEKVAPKSAEQLQEEEAKRQMMEDKRMEAMCKSLKDYDGNKYVLVQIGSQCWMAENLRTTHFADGTAISLGSGRSIPAEQAGDYYRYYPDNNNRNVAVYGYLYNWFTTMRREPSSSNNPSGVQGVCPTGWHVPSEGEWDQLKRYLSMQKQYSCDGKTKNTIKVLASKTGWKESKVPCSPGNMMQENNMSGFNAMPAGYFCVAKGIFLVMKPDFFSSDAIFWTATAMKPSYSIYESIIMQIGYNDKSMDMGWDQKVNGYSVRCLRD